MDQNHKEFIKEAVLMAAKNATSGGGGPFGALIVKNGEIIGRGVNKVTTSNDPTAHAEVIAIRDACKNIDNFKLEGSVIYASCEPCPMCLAAIYWARIAKVYFAAANTDAAKAGFDDSFIYEEIRLPVEKRSIEMNKLDIEEYLSPFDTWIEIENKITY